jgi:hypothetical protein
MRPSVVLGTVRGLALQGRQGLAAPIQNKRAGLGGSKACTSKPMFAATLSGKGYFGQWQTHDRA